MAGQNNRDDQCRNRRYWLTHIKAQQKSGLNRAEYCRQHQLSYHAATYWNRKFSKPASKETTLVPVTFSSSIKINSSPVARSVLKVILPSKIAVEVDDGFSQTTLEKLLMILERR